MAETGFDPAVEQTGEMKKMTADGTVKMIRELCAQLASGEGGFHGNIWPGSVTLDEAGKAILAEGSDAPVSERDAEQVEYLAPEYFWENSGTPASDVYSLGMMLYAGCSNGYLPFQPKGGALTDKDRSAALRKRMKGESFKLPTGISKDLRAVIRKALSYEPESRYQSPAELLEALNATDEALPGLSEASAVPMAAAVEGDEIGEALREEYTRMNEGGESAAEFVPETPVEEIPAERKYTVQKDFEKNSAKTKKKSASSAAPATRKKKKTSPAVPILCVAAAAVIAGGVGWGLTHGGTRQVSETFEVEATAEPEEESGPVVIHTTDKPEATVAPIPLELLPAEDKDEKDDAEAKDKEKEEEEPVVTGSATVDGQDVEPVSDTVYVSGYGVNLRSGPGTSYGVEKTLVRGTKLQRTGTVNGWSQVQYEGKEYYVSSNLIQNDDPFGGTAQSLSNDEKTDGAKTDGTSAGGTTTNNGTNSGGTTAGTTGSTNSGTNSGNTTAGNKSGTNTGTGTGTSTGTSSNANRPTVQQSKPATLVATSDVVTVTGSSVNLRSGAGTNNSVIGTVTSGTVLQRTGTIGGWSRVLYDGKDAYISSNYVKAVSSDNTLSAEGTLKVVSDVNVRSGPGTNYGIYGVARRGETLSIQGVADGGKWYKVSYGGNTGYVNRKLVEVQSIQFTSGQSTGTGTETSYGKVNYDANIRSGPGTGYSIIGDVKAGDTVTITGTENGWYKISSTSGKTGYIASSLVDKSTTSGKANSDANVRSGPGTGYSIIGDVKAGDTVTITGTENNWYKISYNGKTGYIAASLVDKSGSSSSSSSTTSGKANSDANVRSGPGTGYSIIGDVKAGDTVTITGTENNWYKISYNGKTGYIAASLVDKSGSTSSSSSSSSSSNKSGKVNYDANVRSAPGTGNPIIGDVKAGETVTILGSENGWYRISYDGKTGYIASSLVEETGTASAYSNATGRANSDANIRSGPGTDYSIVGDIAAGQTFTILETKSNNWYKIEYNGITGYIAGSLVDKA